MRLLPVFLIVMSMTCLLAEELPRPQVPDPFGLGERLALVDYLRETCKLSPPPDATMEQLVEMYWKHHRKERDAIKEDATDQALAADRVRRLRLELKEKYQIDAPAEADEAALGRLLNDARTKATDEAMKEVRDKAAARENPSSPQEAARFAEQDRAAAEARLDSIAQDEQAVRAEIRKIDEQRRGLVDQGREQLEQLGKLRSTYNNEVKKHNDLVSHYERKNQEGSPDALKIYDQIKAQRQVLDQAKAAADQQDAQINALAKQDEDLAARQARLQEKLAGIAKRRSEEAGAPVSRPPTGPTTPGGYADQPAAGSQQAKLAAGVVLLVIKNAGTGTGFIVTRDGLVVTNAHVLGSRNAEVMAMWDASANRRPVRMTVVEYAEADDLALLRAEDAGPFEPLPMSEVYELQRPLIAAGFPLASSVAGTLQTSPSDIVVSRGILGSLRRAADGRVEWLQHDCRVASGNSGGPVIDHQTGAVIGVTTMVLATDGVKSHGDGINLAIPIRKVKDRFAAHLKP